MIHNYLIRRYDLHSNMLSVKLYVPVRKVVLEQYTADQLTKIFERFDRVRPIRSVRQRFSKHMQVP